MADYDDTGKLIADTIPDGPLTEKTLRRADVVNAFHKAFEQIGGVPRLSLWADAQPTEFYKLYARLLPSAASDELNGVSTLKIVHALAPPNYDPRPPEKLPAKQAQE